MDSVHDKELSRLWGVLAATEPGTEKYQKVMNEIITIQKCKLLEEKQAVDNEINRERASHEALYKQQELDYKKMVADKEDELNQARFNFEKQCEHHKQMVEDERLAYDEALRSREQIANEKRLELDKQEAKRKWWEIWVPAGTMTLLYVVSILVDRYGDFIKSKYTEAITRMVKPK